MKKRINPAKGYICGMLSGLTWGLDTVILGVAMAMAPFAENKVLVLGGGILAAALHDVFSAVWLSAYMAMKGRLPELALVIKTRDGRFCALAALFGGPFAMTFYTLAIGAGGAALTANVTAIYPLLGTALAVLILREKTGPQTWIGLVLCVLGILVMGYTPSDGTSVNVFGGIALAFGAAVGWAAEGVVCGYGMKDGKVDPILALLIREVTSALAYLFVVAPLFLKGFVNVGLGTAAIFSDISCGLLIVLTALIGMSSFGLWYTAIDNIGAAKGLCLNVTYSFWAVVLTVLLSVAFPSRFSGSVTLTIALGSVFMLGGVTMATLYRAKSEEKRSDL